MLVEMEYARLHDKFICFSQRIHLCLHDARMVRDAQIVTAIQSNCVGSWHSSVQDEFAAALLVPTRHEIAGSFLRQFFCPAPDL